MPQTKVENRTLDLLKGLCCAVIVSSHLPSFWTSEQVDNFYLSWFLRICVPVFFLSSGYYFFLSQDKPRQLRRIALLYGFGYLLYLPAILKGIPSFSEAISALRWNLVIGYEHLWYLNATLFGLVIWFFLDKLPAAFQKRLYPVGIPVCLLLLFWGAVLDEYYPLIPIPFVSAAGEFLSRFGGPRNVVFLGFPLLFLGGSLAKYRQFGDKVPTVWLAVFYLVFRAAAFGECWFLLDRRGGGISTDITFFNWVPALVLVLLTFRFPVGISAGLARRLRAMIVYVYILHPLVGAYLSQIGPIPPVFLWIATMLFCAGVYLFLEALFSKKKA